MTLRQIKAKEDVQDVVAHLTAMADFWSHAHGWAPSEAAELLSISRLDRIISLAKCLNIWVEQIERGIPEELYEGMNILRWTNLAAVVEGILKWFPTVWLNSYWNDAITDRNGKPIAPDVASFENLRKWYKQTIWHSDDLEIWDEWLLRIQQFRNSIHAFKNRPVGSTEEFLLSLTQLRRFLNRIDEQLPYPDEMYYQWISTE